MAEYMPSPRDWVREQVEQYESSGGKEGTTLRETGLSVIIVTNIGNKTGAVRKTPLMRAVDGPNYILVASTGGAPKHPVWYFNLKANPSVKIQDGPNIHDMTVREINTSDDRKRLWDIAVNAYPPYQEYQDRTDRIIPVFLAEPDSKTT